MRNELLNQYKILVNFLGKTLGPSFEIVLHEIKGEEIKMIAIANGEISNRTLENSISSETLNILKNKSYHNEENSTDNMENFMEKIFQEINLKFNYPLERLTKQEREKIVKALYEKGIFNLKEAINFVAKKLSCSPTTIYRYVGKIEKV